MASIAKLLDDLATFGTDRIVFPIDMWELANAFAGHDDRRSAISGLRGFLPHEWNFQRHIAVRALRLIGGDALSDDVIDQAASMVLEDDAPNVRAEAARLLAAGRRTPRVRAALIKAANSDDTVYVREEAQRALQAKTTD
jgi:hypothetical protein